MILWPQRCPSPRLPSEARAVLNTFLGRKAATPQRQRSCQELEMFRGRVPLLAATVAAAVVVPVAPVAWAAPQHRPPPRRRSVMQLGKAPHPAAPEEMPAA